ncbi:hypothetical protein OG279_09660 [Streptomyces sp. NBC_01201]|uniref:hypothetical protein n=1 Tax=unclassified Streptomyces TaxID=2593676 RepID=UPI002E0EE280|nr:MULTISPECIES: hypothetical protein [unclassified Streptomyces]WSR09400.1 hypothetical protein OG265_26825 [Streptomyces sp. NBC_01208]WSR47872.1 hypothetical protein OG279_09660 [Streptomyces sp. NBC_01201]
MPGSFQILGTGQLLELQRKLRAAGHENIRSSMQRRIRRAAEPLRNDLQSTVRGLSIRSTGRGAGKRGGPSPTTRPLRASIAQAIRISVRTGGNPGARVWLDKGLLPPDIPPGVVNRLNEGRLRHPVFGNKRRWAQQNTTPLWWDKTVRKHTPRMQSEVARVLDDVRRRIE